MTINAIEKTVSDQGAIAGIKDRVLGAVKRASDATGVDFSYLLAKAERESSLNPAAKAKSSTATGLFQFIEQTWLSMVKNHGEQYGLGAYADHITCANGCMRVADPALKKEILELRKDPEVCSLMAAEMAKENKAVLENKLGGDIGNTEMYLAHFLGPAGAAKLIKAARDNPSASAATLLPDAARANHSVFYGRDGKALSAQAVYDRVAHSMEAPKTALPMVEVPAVLAKASGACAISTDVSVDSSNSWGAPSLQVAHGLPSSEGHSNAFFGSVFAAQNQSLFTTMLLAQGNWPTEDVELFDKNNRS